MPSPAKPSLVEAVADEILPKFGLAYLVDDSSRTWAVTSRTEGPGLDTLKSGRRLKLTLAHHDDFSVVSRYELLS